jgi:hypothetical protein
MLTEGQGVNSPRSIVTDHYLLGPMLIISPKILEEGTLDPANIICWTLTGDNLLGLLPGLLK